MNIRLEEIPRPAAGIGEGVIRVTLATIFGTDLHIVRGEYPVKGGQVIGHEPVCVIDALGEGMSGYEIGDLVFVGAITPCGQCRVCLSAQWSQCGQGSDAEAPGGGRFVNTINGAQAEQLQNAIRQLRNSVRQLRKSSSQVAEIVFAVAERR